jgi:hypothetical protein
VGGKMSSTVPQSAATPAPSGPDSLMPPRNAPPTPGRSTPSSAGTQGSVFARAAAFEAPAAASAAPHVMGNSQRAAPASPFSYASHASGGGGGGGSSQSPGSPLDALLARHLGGRTSGKGRAILFFPPWSQPTTHVAYAHFRFDSQWWQLNKPQALNPKS